MTGDEYLSNVLQKYYTATGTSSPGYQAGNSIYPEIKSWGTTALLAVYYSGSYAKGTAIKGSTDMDLFISLSPDTQGTLQEIYNSLFKRLSSNGYNPRKQNVSIGLTINDMSVDLIPAKKRESDNYHSIWSNRNNSWTQTNIHEHIELVKASGRINEIKLAKIWRKLHSLDLPSFYLELTVIDALYNKRHNNLADNFQTVLAYLRDRFQIARVEDPSNSNNVVSNDLSDSGKLIIAKAAENSLNKQYWTEIVW